MMFNQYQNAVNAGFVEYLGLSAKRKLIDAELEKIGQLIVANINMLPDEERQNLLNTFAATKEPEGLSDAIMRVLTNADCHLSATEVRNALTSSGYGRFINQHVNALASIHTTLTRLAKDGRAVEILENDHKAWSSRALPFRFLSEVICEKRSDPEEA